jgi:hypothetical protein
MTTITQQDFAQFCSELGETSQLKKSIEVLENNLKDCDWILEDAATLIAVEAGESVLMGDSLLEELVEKSRTHLCKPEVRKEFLPTPLPLVVTCLFKLWEIGLRNLCKENERLTSGSDET